MNSMKLPLFLFCGSLAACSSAGGGSSGLGGMAGMAGSGSGGLGSGGSGGASSGGGAAGSSSGGAAGAAGGGGAGFVPSQSDDVWLLGEVDTSGVFEIARLDMPSKSKQKLPLAFQSAKLAASRDGKHLAIASLDAASTLLVATYTVQGQLEHELFSESGKSVPKYVPAVGDIAYSADATWVAVSILGAAPDYRYELFVAPADGSKPALKLTPPGFELQGFRFAPDGETLAVYDPTTLYLAELSAAPASLTELAQGKFSSTGAGVDFDRQGRVYFLAGTPALVSRIGLDGAGPGVLAATALTDSSSNPTDVNQLDVSPDGKHLAFAGWGQALVMGVDDAKATKLYAPSSGSVGGSFTWGPDGKLGALGSWTLGSTQCTALLVFEPSGAASPRLTEVQWNKGGPSSPLFSSDGTRLYFRGEMVNYGHYDVYSLANFTAKDQDWSTLVAEGVPLKADVEVVVAY